MAFSALSLCLAPLSIAADGTFLMYVGTYTDKSSKGIYAFRFNAARGEASPLGVVAVSNNPSFLAVGQDDRFVYAVNEVDTFRGEAAGAVSAFATDRSTGKLTVLNQVSSLGPGPAHLSLDKSGRYLLVANYGGGSVAVLPIGNDGRLGTRTSLIQGSGSSVNKQRQESPHAHEVIASNDNRFVLVPDLGSDKLLIFGFDQETGKLTLNNSDSASVVPGSGPRHVAFAPAGRFVYLLNELTATVMVFSFDLSTGKLNLKQTVATLPGNFSGENTAAEIVVDASGRHLYVSNRGADSITVFAVSLNDGSLSEVQRIATGGKTPRHFALDPTGHWLFAANQDSDSIALFRVDPSTGKLSDSGKVLQVPTPVCVVFVPSR